MNKEQYFQLKAELKLLARFIKINAHNARATTSIAHGGTQKLIEEPVWESPLNSYGLWKARYEYRHKHIVISLARGKTRDQIETPKPENQPDERYIQKLLEIYADAEQTVRVGS